MYSIAKHPKATPYGRQNPICAAWNSEERLIEWRKAWADEVNSILAKHGSVERIDHRSHEERGLDELPTIHEGVTARAMEKRGIAADRCAWNRVIKAGNRILRELKAKLEKLLQTVLQIAEALENIRSRLIVIRYQILGVGQQKQYYSNWLDRTLPIVEQYKEIGKAIEARYIEKKELQVKCEKCTTIQFVKKHDLTVKLSAITEEIEDLKAEKAMLTSKLACATDTDVQVEEKSLLAMKNELPSLDNREAELTENENSELEQYKEVSTAIAPPDKDIVWDARAELRPAITAKVQAVLQKGYGNKYDHSRFVAARREIGYELGEEKYDDAALSVRRRQKIAHQKMPEKMPEKMKNKQDFEK